MTFYHEGDSATIIREGDRVRGHVNPRQRPAANHPRTKPAGHHAKRAPWSAQSSSTMLGNGRVIDPENTPGTTYLVTLKPPKGVTPKEFDAAMKRVTAWCTDIKAQIFLVLEWGWRENAPHIHIVANSEMPDFPKKIITRWLSALPFEPDLREQQDCRIAYNPRGAVDYLMKMRTKSEDYNRKAAASGANWSRVAVHSCSRGWAKLPVEKIAMSKKHYHRLRRIILKGNAANAKTIKQHRKILNTLRGHGKTPEAQRRTSEMRAVGADRPMTDSHLDTVQLIWCQVDRDNDRAAAKIWNAENGIVYERTIGNLKLMLLLRRQLKGVERARESQHPC